MTVRLQRGEEIELDSGYLGKGHLDYGYAVTAHKAQGASVDRAFVLGSDELYREWGYTALSRHREESRFYIVSPASTERQLPQLERHEDPIVEQLATMLGDSHAKQLALHQIPAEIDVDGVDPHLQRFRALTATKGCLAEEMSRTEAERRRVQESLDRLRKERGALGLFARRERERLDLSIAGNGRALEFWSGEADRHGAKHADAAQRLSQWLVEHGEQTVGHAAAREHQAQRDHERHLDTLRDRVACHELRPAGLHQRDDWSALVVRDATRDLQPDVEPPPLDTGIDVGLDMGF